MREILFRGQDNLGVWHYGYLHINIIAKKEEKYYINSNCYVENPNYIEVNKETVGQATDSNDIDGNRIFEGDRVLQRAVLVGDDMKDFIGYVKFLEGSWVIENKDGAIPLWSEHRENTVLDLY